MAIKPTAVSSTETLGRGGRRAAQLQPKAFMPRILADVSAFAVGADPYESWQSDPLHTRFLLQEQRKRAWLENKEWQAQSKAREWETRFRQRDAEFQALSAELAVVHRILGEKMDPRLRINNLLFDGSADEIFQELQKHVDEGTPINQIVRSASSLAIIAELVSLGKVEIEGDVCLLTDSGRRLLNEYFGS